MKEKYGANHGGSFQEAVRLLFAATPLDCLPTFGPGLRHVRIDRELHVPLHTNDCVGLRNFALSERRCQVCHMRLTASKGDVKLSTQPGLRR